MAKTKWCGPLAMVLGWAAAGLDNKVYGESGLPQASPSSQSWRELKTLVESSQNTIPNQENLASELGSTNFSVREKATKSLLSLGLRARKPLREVLQSPDPEVRFRAREILEQVPPLPNSWEIRSWLVSNKKGNRGSEGLVESPRNGPPLNILLSILDSIEDESLRVNIHCWMARHYRENDLPTATPESVPVKTLKMFFKGFHGPRDGNETSGFLEPLARYHHLRGQFEAGHPISVYQLAELVPNLPQDCQNDVESILLSRSGAVNALNIGTGSRTDLASFVSFWAADKEAKVCITDEIKGNKKSLYVCEYDGIQGGRVCRLDELGNLSVSQTRLQGPNDFHILPGDRVLVAERNSSQITLRNSKGDICWSWQCPSVPIQCKRLDGGKTFFATFTDIGIVNLQGRVELTLPIKDGVRFAAPTADHGFLVLNSRGELLQLDARGTILKTISHCPGSSGSGYWGHVITRANGNLICAFAGTHTIAEISPKGDLIRQASVRCPVNVKEREDGGLWVCSFDSKTLVELDSQWVQVKKIPLPGRPFGFGRMD